MTEFESTVCGIPCIICIRDWDSYMPAILRAEPGDSHPAEGGCGNWEVLDRRGRAAPWLERKVTSRERTRIDQEIFNHLENEYDEY